jgi:hypothetical protein
MVRYYSTPFLTPFLTPRLKNKLHKTKKCSVANIYILVTKLVITALKKVVRTTNFGRRNQSDTLII